jgi:hypothetical protein
MMPCKGLSCFEATHVKKEIEKETSKWSLNINTAVYISFKHINILLWYCKVNYRYVLRLMDKAFFVTIVFVSVGRGTIDSSIKI